jgi:cytidylate kinase
MTRKNFPNPEIANIVNRQIGQWGLSHSIQDKQEKQERLASGAEIDYITISRELGSGGEEIARTLSDLMKWQLYDREILNYMSQDLNVHVKALESVDEQTIGWIKDSLAPLFNVKTSQHVEQLSYYKHLGKVLLVIAKHGRAVIVGRAAGLLLPRDRGLSVRVTASFEHRCKQIAEKNNISFEDAVPLVKKAEETQKNFVKNFLGQDISDTKHYDIICNTEKLSPRAIAKLIWRAFDQRMVTRREQLEAEVKDVETIVQRQIEQWRLENTVQDKIDKMQVRLASGAEIDYITISRELGSGGEEIARMLSDLMKWQLYDHEILDYMAENMDVHVKALESVDEKTRGWIKTQLIPLFGSQSPQNVSQASYYKHLGEALLVTAQHGRAIIVGRAANLVLPRRRGLNVRITAPLEVRCKYYAKKHNINISKAASIVKNADKDQKRFVKDFVGKDITDSRHYDLVCNTEKLYPASVAKLICRAFDQRVMSEQEHSAE